MVFTFKIFIILIFNLKETTGRFFYYCVIFTADSTLGLNLWKRRRERTPRFILFVLLQLSSKKSDTIRLNYCIMCLLFKFTKISTYVKIAMFYATYHVCSEIYRILSGEVYSAKLVEFCEYSIIFLELIKLYKYK